MLTRNIGGIANHSLSNTNRSNHKSYDLIPNVGLDFPAVRFRIVLSTRV